VPPPETAVRIAGRNPLLQGFLGLGYARSGRTAEARKLLDELQELARKEYVSFFSLMTIYLGLGEIDNAFELLEKAVDERELKMIHLHIDPLFDPLRSHPRYRALLRRMNLDR
jgi:tetratricopeptide (TPR) repeat protein